MKGKNMILIGACINFPIYVFSCTKIGKQILNDPSNTLISVSLAILMLFAFYLILKGIFKND